MTLIANESSGNFIQLPRFQIRNGRLMRLQLHDEY